MVAMLRVLWSYRGFILGSIKREFQAKYRNSLVGAAWAVLNPLAMIVVYTVIFAEVVRAKLPGVDDMFAYSIYLCAGVLAWSLFAEIVGRGQNVFLENANLLKKLNFPRLCLPAIIIGTALINFTIIFFLFLGFLLITGNFPGVEIFAIFPLLGGLILFAIGLGVSLGVLNVFFRDVGQFFSIFLNFWFWLTPIIYPSSVLEKDLGIILDINPMFPVISGFQKVFVEKSWPQWDGIWLPYFTAVILCVFGMVIFRKHSGEMVDEL